MPQALARSLFSSEVEIEEADPRALDGALEALLPGEESAIERAVTKRRQQYAAGRLCARRALRRLGLDTDTPIPSGKDRAPIWPEGFTGSISHTDNWCAVAVARRDQARSIGLDVEQADSLRDTLINKICVPEELCWLESLAADERGTMAKVIFSAKECAYKCQYPLTREYLGFHAMELSLDLDSHEFTATFRQPAGEFQPGDVIEGGFLIERKLIVTGCTIAP